jgi:diguanylate cyclase (GGDEF)-like protein
MAVVQSPDLTSAITLLTSELSELFSARVTVFEKRDGGWRVISGAQRTFNEREWHARLAVTPAGRPALLPVGDARSEQATVLPLGGPTGPPLALVLDGDWTADDGTLKVFALLVSMGLDSLRQRDERRAAERRLVAAYGVAKRLSRLTETEQLSQQTVDRIAALLDADRVSLALYDKNEQTLSIVATHGYPLSQVKDVRIPAGAWVIGHVFSNGRPIFVDDARLLPGMHHERYRSTAFAAVPLLAGHETVGVLSVTEKRHGARFGRDDEILLRGMSVIAGLAVAAARSTSEAAVLAHAATIDSVTNLSNRQYLDNRLREEVARSKREGTTLAVLIGDIDDFKRVNDAFGHQVGDQVLRFAGGVIRSTVRVFDVCARYGGDEFAILMPNCDRDSAIACAERIRRRVAHHDGRERGAGWPALTMSIGVAVIEKDEDAVALMSRADQYLYQAKAEGKNLVRAAAAARFGEPAEATQAAGLTGSVPPAYMLIADANEERADLCATVARELGIRVSVARSSHQALSTLAQAGPPATLIVDLSLPPAGGFAIIDAVDSEQETDIIAWSAGRAMTEYASRQPLPRARVLNGRAAPETIRATVQNVLRRHATGSAPRRPAMSSPENADKIMKTLAEQARQLCDAAGVAVCLRTPGDTGFRTFVDWTSDESLPHLPYAVPQALDRVIETGRTIPDVHGVPPLDVAHDTMDNTTRGLAAVPIVLEGQVAGAMCIFDARPLVLDDRAVAALARIGRNGFTPIAARPSPSVAGPPPFRDRADDRHREGDVAGKPTPQIEWPPTILERRGGEFAVARELARARREGRQLSVVLFDVGPALAAEPSGNAPDEYLNSVGDTLLRAIRQSDLPIRWNVSELLVVLPGLTGHEARSVAERVRAALQAGGRNRLRVSGGVAELENDERFADVVERARQKVAMAVGRGHNRVV